MGDLVDLDEYREQKRKEEEADDSDRADRFDEIMAWLEDFLERNPPEVKPYYVSPFDLNIDLFYSLEPPTDKEDNEPDESTD